jgi:competence protein ComEC
MRVNRDAGVVVEGRAPWYDGLAALSRFRGELARRLSESIPAETLPFVLTIWLGDRRQIDSDLYQSFIESGTAHILSVSGIHIAIIFVSLRMLMRVLVPRRRLRLVVLLVSVVAFAGMTGAQVATIRATIMIAAYLLAEWFDREPDAPTALGIAAAIFAIHDPGVLYDIAFQLSFLSVASLLLFDGAIAGTLEWLPTALREAMAGTLAVQLLPLPVAIHTFHVLPMAAPFVNLLVIPLTGVVLWLGFLTSVAAFALPAAAPLFGYALHPAVQGVLWISTATADTGRVHLRMTSPTFAALAAYAAAMLAAYIASRRPEGRRGVWLAGAGLAALLCVALWSPIRPRPEVTVLDVGHGDAIFVRAPGGATMLVDAGPRSEFADEGERTVAPFLWANHVTKLDVLMITHPDADHVGGSLFLLEHFRVASLVLGPEPYPGTLEDDVIAVCEQRGVPVKRLARGDQFTLGGARVEVLHPPRPTPAGLSENDRSLVARVTWPGMSALLAGDVERAGEEALLAAGPDAAVLKVPHHGSITSSSEAFIDAVRPAVAVISVAKRGRRTVLSPEVVRRYNERGVAVLQTDIVGGVRFRPSGEGLRVEAARLQRGFVTRENS